MEHLWQAQPSGGNPTYYESTYTPGMEFTHFGQPIELNNMSQSAYSVEDTAATTAYPSQSNQTNTKVAGNKRNANYSGKEDEVLISAYLNVSKDAAVGTNQSSMSYWKRISDYFNEHKTTPLERSQHSLEHRWGQIQRDTTKFCGFFDKVLRLNQSGKSDDDKVKDALQMYEGLVKKPFKYLHCWMMLRNEMKWNAWLTSLEVQADQVEPTGNLAAEEGNEGVPEPAANDMMPRPITRPMGRDKAKKQRTSSTAASNSTACFEMLQKFQEDRAKYEEQVVSSAREESQLKMALKERQVKATEEMLKLQRFDVEDRIMSKDLETLAPAVREYYIRQQKKILANMDNE